MVVDPHTGGLPVKRKLDRIPLAEVDSKLLLGGIALWRRLCDGAQYPRRSAVTPRELKALLRNTALLRVVDGGKDYECRIVGDAFVMAHGRSFQGMFLNEMEPVSPAYQRVIRPILDRVICEGAPVATRGWIGRGFGSAGQVYSEYVFLPLGKPESGIDHILIFAVYIRDDGLAHVGRPPGSSFDV